MKAPAKVRAGLVRRSGLRASAALSLVLAGLLAVGGTVRAQTPDPARGSGRDENPVRGRDKPEVALQRYGAIAVSPPERTFRASPILGTREAAEAAAMSSCQADGGTDCQVATWFRNACGALALGVDGGWGASWGVDRGVAERNALEWCHRYTTECRVVSVQCTEQTKS